MKILKIIDDGERVHYQGEGFNTYELLGMAESLRDRCLIMLRNNIVPNKPKLTYKEFNEIADVSVRLHNVIRNNEIMDVLALEPKELMRMRNCGKRSVVEFIEWKKEYLSK